jgi:DNA polymerase III delta subunit
MINKTAIQNNKKFLLHCADTFLSSVFVDECHSVYKDHTVEYCFSTDSFTESLNRGSLFNDNKRILVLTDLSDDNIQDIEPFTNYDTDDVIILIEKSTLKKNKEYVRIKTNYAYVKIEDLPERECKSWLHTYMIREGLKFAPEIPAYIIKRRGTDLGALSNEVRKLKLLGKEVTEDICNYVVSISNDSDFYVFIDHFSHKRLANCLKEFYKVDENKYVSLLHFMLGYVEKLYKIAIYRDQKKATDEIADLMGLPKFILQTKYYTVLSIFSKVKLLKMMDLLNELDLQLRVSQFDKTLLFETYIMKVFKL